MSCVDVIVPCYKYAHYLRQCVESVLAQSHGDFKMLIIDDLRSPDHAEEVAQGLVAQDGRVAYRPHESNRGHIATYNEGLEWAEGDYVLLLSADDFLTSGALERAVKMLDSHPQSGVYPRPSSPLSRARSGGFPNLFILRASSVVADLRGERIHRTVLQFGPQPCRHTDRGHSEFAPEERWRISPWDLPAHAADLELWLRLAASGAVCRIEEDQACKRMHATSNMQHQFLETALGDLQQQLEAALFVPVP